ncbi:2-oxo-4-hydroxy-4-carboxy-5-ureidoimidazoline decarboxylase [Rhodobacteraceae bacterium RKSG542]|uniref:2-oxo-4-hydroxy-4-carboxy-5-ureidoimidazoline decarboxylase n=1 Tax=Pseudovibrio flavus TaxID=2529854 RepID=UPI003526CC40|nr:2-oxo-4-hydroxy-4-carboxy-5-ureidoimidazoline decarboxylase [Pseudovibrio flavus]
MAYSLEAVNALSQDEFVDVFGDIAEHSPWVAEKAAAYRPYASRGDVIDSFAKGMNGADEGAQLALIRAHPDLAGKAARAGQVAEASRNEQAGAGLDQLTDEEFQRFTELNDAYKARFGFPFILAVKGATKHIILEAFEKRLQNSAQEEFAEALTQIARIFRFRLEDAVLPDE